MHTVRRTSIHTNASNPRKNHQRHTCFSFEVVSTSLPWSSTKACPTKSKYSSSPLPITWTQKFIDSHPQLPPEQDQCRSWNHRGCSNETGRHESKDRELCKGCTSLLISAAMTKLNAKLRITPESLELKLRILDMETATSANTNHEP